MNLKKTLSILFVVFIFLFLGWSVFNNWKTISNFQWNFRPSNLMWLILSSAPIFLINSLSWHFITKSLGSKVGFKDNFKVWMLSNASRFFPGGFWQYPGRIYLLNKKGETKTLGTSAVLIEALMNLAVGSLIVFGGSFFVQFPFELNQLRFLLLLVFLIPVVAIKYPQITILKRTFSKLFKKDFKLDQLNFSWSNLFILSFLFFLQYFFSGLSLFWITKLAIDLPFNLVPNFVVIFTASWLLGYLVIFAPGGLGVQEISIAALLSSLIPFSIAGVVAILFRVVLYLAEFITLTIVLSFNRDFKDDKKTK